MRTYLSCAMALLCLPLFTEPIAAQSSDSSQLRCDSTVIYNVNDIIVGKIINVYDQRGNILSETTYSGDNITKKVEYTYSGQGYKTTTYLQRIDELELTEEIEYNNLGQEVVKIEYPVDNYSQDANIVAQKNVFTYHTNGEISSKSLYQKIGNDEYWTPTEHYEYDIDGNLTLVGYGYLEYDDDGNPYYPDRDEYTYDSLGNETGFYRYCSFCGKIYDLEEYTYDNQGRLSTMLSASTGACHKHPYYSYEDWEHRLSAILCQYTYYEEGKISCKLYESKDTLDSWRDYYVGWWHNVSMSEIPEDLQWSPYYPIRRLNCEYDSFGNKTLECYYDLGLAIEEDHSWYICYSALSYIRVFDYDDQNHLTSESYYTYSNEDGRWVGEYSREYIYDENGHRLSTIYYKEAYITSRSVSNNDHQDSNYQWVYDTKTDYTYDEEGNVIKTTSYKWSNNQWNEGNHTIYYYTADTQTIETITKAPLLVSPRKVFKDGKLQIEINGQCYGIAGERL